jgi:hypothetical protein
LGKGVVLARIMWLVWWSNGLLGCCLVKPLVVWSGPILVCRVDMVRRVWVWVLCVRWHRL